jgi:hypothetical protein
MPNDAAEARAVLTHRGISVSGTFGFSGDGLVSRCAGGTATYAHGPVMAGLPLPPNWLVALLQLPQRRLREGTGQWRHRADTVGGALPRIQAVGVSVSREGRSALGEECPAAGPPTSVAAVKCRLVIDMRLSGSSGRSKGLSAGQVFVPTVFEAAWMQPDGTEQAYVRCRLTGLAAA